MHDYLSRSKSCLGTMTQRIMEEICAIENQVDSDWSRYSVCNLDEIHLMRNHSGGLHIIRVRI